MSDAPAEELRRLRSRPLCIICGRPAEAQAIANELGIENNRVSGREVEKINDGHTFFTGSFDIKGKTLDYYVTSSIRQGIQSFAIHSSILFHILRPRFVIHAGVCAAYYEDDAEGDPVRKLKDVIFGEAAINFEEGKWERTSGDAAPVFKPDFDVIRTPAGDMQAFAESKSRPQYHYGGYISGSAVRNDASTVFQKIRTNVARNSIALDMEASAFLKLCAFAGTSSLGVVKGISDFGDSEKGKDPDSYEGALRNTAVALREWIIHTIPAMNWQLDEDDQPGVSLSHGYYNNFVRHVLDSHSQGLLANKKLTSYEAIPREEVKGLKIIMPDGMRPNFFAEAGHISRIMEEYQLQEVNIGQLNFCRSLYYKAGWLFDFPRTVNSLVQYPDSTHQVKLFASRLHQKDYFSSPVKDREPLALLCTWEEFVEWLKETKEKEEIKEKAETEAVRPALVNGGKTETVYTEVNGVGPQHQGGPEVSTGSAGQGGASREGDSTLTRSTFPLTTTEKETTGGKRVSKRPSIFKFWRKGNKVGKTI